MTVTKLAKGQLCTVRLQGICNFDPATTVAAHYSLTGVSGRGIKSPSSCVAWACSACHDVIDGRKYTNIPRDQLRLCHLEGVIRTLAALDSMGYELKLVGGPKMPKIFRRTA